MLPPTNQKFRHGNSLMILPQQLLYHKNYAHRLGSLWPVLSVFFQVVPRQQGGNCLCQRQTGEE